MGLSVQNSISVCSCREGRYSPPFLQLSQPTEHTSLRNTVPVSPFKLRIYTFASCNLRSSQNCNQGQMGLWRQGRTATRRSHQHRGDIGTFPGKWGRHTACMSDSCQLLSSLCFFPASPRTSSLTICAWRAAALGPGPDDIITLSPASHSFHASVSDSFASLSALLSSAHCVHFRLLL